MAEIKINAATQIPPKGKRTYPFRAMQIGESFSLGEYTKIKSSSIAGFVWYYSKHKSQLIFNKKFTQRKVEISKDVFHLLVFREK